MKKSDWMKLALSGLASGLICSNHAAAADFLNSPSQCVFSKLNSEQQKFILALASHECKGFNNCGGLTAMRDVSKDSSKKNEPDPNDSNMSYHLMTEDELLLELNDQGRKLYESLDPEGKTLARFTASQMCAATNKCKGLNSCATDKNACMGKGDCKGKSKCGFADKNLAVKVVADKMAKKREQSMNVQ